MNIRERKKARKKEKKFEEINLMNNTCEVIALMYFFNGCVGVCRFENNL